MKINSKTTLYIVFACVALLVGLAPAVFIYTVDPYAVFVDKNRPSRISDIAEKAHYPLFKLARYRPGTHHTVVLGDSRARALQERYWHRAGVNGVLNLAYGGGTIPEIYSTFQIIKDDPSVKNLVIGIQLRSFDERMKKGLNRVPEAVRLLSNRLQYLQNWSVFKAAGEVAQAEYPATWKLLASIVPSPIALAEAGNDQRHELTLLGPEGTTDLSTLLRPDVCYGCSFPKNLPSVRLKTSAGRYLGLDNSGLGHRWLPHTWGRLTNWQDVAAYYPAVRPEIGLKSKFSSQIASAHRNWAVFEFSRDYWAKFEEMAEWARAEDRNLYFFVPPTVLEMQQSIVQGGQGAASHQLREELSRFGTVFDFDFGSELTAEVENFTDALHFNHHVSQQLIREMAALIEFPHVAEVSTKQPKIDIDCASMNPPSRTVKTRYGGEFREGKSCRVWRGSNS